MLTVEQYDIAILNARLAMARLVTRQIKKEQEGGDPCWDEPIAYYKKIRAAGAMRPLINTILGSKLYFDMVRLSGTNYNSSLSVPDGLTIIPVGSVLAPVVAPSVDAGALSIPIPEGSPIPFKYDYTGAMKVKYYFVEYLNVDGSYTLANTIQTSRDDDEFTVEIAMDEDGNSIGNYRLNLVLI